MTKANELDNQIEPQRNFSSGEGNISLFNKVKNKFRKCTKPDLTFNCLLCDTEFAVKYIPSKKRYSLKNNWGYWTKKASDQHKYLCNTCLMKLHVGKMTDWIKCESRADVFYNYVKRGQFGKKDF